jgi:Holliday junction resolvasome RuvABC endonuclease subunit
MLVAIDPSIRSLGIAVFDAGQLHKAGVVRPRDIDPTASKGQRAVAVADRIMDWLDAETADWTGGSDGPHLIFEWPQIYTAVKSKGNPNDLLVTVSPALVLSGYATFASIRTPTPAEWAGQTKKATRGDPWKSQRAQMVARRLSPDERKLIPSSHDAIDAVGLGLWAIGRFERRYINAGATPG